MAAIVPMSALATGSTRITYRIMMSPAIWLATSPPRSNPSTGSSWSSLTIRLRMRLTTNSRSIAAICSLLTALRSRATAAAPAGESQTDSMVATSRSPTPSRPPARIAEITSAGSSGACSAARNS